METKINTPYMAVTVDGAYPRNTLMALDTSNGKATAATATTVARDLLGHLTEESFADGDNRTVRLLNAPGTHVGLASGAIALTDSLTVAAAGKIEAGGTGQAIGAANETAADGEYFEYRVVPN